RKGCWSRWTRTSCAKGSLRRRALAQSRPGIATSRGCRPMRTLITAFLLVLCGAAQAEKLSADTPKTTTLGNTFIAPAGWSVSVRGPATINEAPEGDSRIVIVDVRASDADAAVAAGWAAYQKLKWPLKVATDRPDKDGWSKRRSYSYETSPNERRDVSASAAFANDVWTVSIYDMAQAVGDKRLAQ